MRIRMPGWCRNALLRINGKLILRPTIVNQYIVINRTMVEQRCGCLHDGDASDADGSPSGA